MDPNQFFRQVSRMVIMVAKMPETRCHGFGASGSGTGAKLPPRLSAIHRMVPNGSISSTLLDIYPFGCNYGLKAWEYIDTNPIGYDIV